MANAKQYVKKYHLEPGTKGKFDRMEFVDEFASDFKNALEGAGISSSRKISRKTFQNVIDGASIKWWKIFNGSKIKREEAEGLWKLFYAKHVATIRQDLYVRAGIIKGELDKEPLERRECSEEVLEMAEAAERKFEK